MAVTSVPFAAITASTSPQSVRQWSKMLTHETIGRTWMKKFMGTSPNSIIQLHRDLEAGRGDNIKIDLLRQLTSYGVTGDTTLKGAEEALVFVQMNVLVDQMRQGVLYQSMSQQRTVHEFRTLAKDALADWFARVLDEAMFAVLAGTAGANAALGTFITNHNGLRLTALDANHVIDGTAAGVGNFDFDHITMLREKARTPVIGSSPPFFRIPPIRTEEGEDVYVLVLHPYQVTSLKTKAGTTGKLGWQDLMSNAGERGSKNPIFTGAVGMFDSCIIHESPYVPRGAPGEYTLTTENANTTAALLLGAQAGHIAFGNPYSKLGGMRDYGPVTETFTYVEDIDDYGNSRGAGGAAIVGLERGQYSTDGAGGGTFASVSHGTLALFTDSPPAVV